MPRALNLLRASLHYRKEAFDAGLRAVGYGLVQQMPDPGPGDLLVIWNRYGGYDVQATQFEQRGATVVVAENGYLGKAWRGGDWFALALSHHSGAGTWRAGGPERWDSWGIELAPWRESGETVILAQRGIGEPALACSAGWADAVQRRVGGRIRRHPGTGPALALDQDLKACGQVVTWHSGAALLALTMGIPVWHGFPQWIGAGAGRPMDQYGADAKRSDADRLAMFQRLAWSTWNLDEIRNGQAFAHLLGA